MSATDLLLFVTAGFQQNRSQFNQVQIDDVLYRTTVSSIHYNVGTEIDQDAVRQCDYDIDKPSQACGEVVSCYSHLCKVITLQLYPQSLVTERDFKTPIINDFDISGSI